MRWSRLAIGVEHQVRDVGHAPAGRGDVRRDCGRSANKSDIGDPISFRAIRPLQVGRRRCLGLYRLCRSYELKGNPGFLRPGAF